MIIAVTKNPKISHTKHKSASESYRGSAFIKVVKEFINANTPDTTVST